MFDYHIKEIENPDFQIQFVAISGFSVLELVLSNDANVRSLLADMKSGQVKNQEVFERILHLLPLVANEGEHSYDGSIVVYLHCLADRVPSLAYEASSYILTTGGLFWSRQLARANVQAFQTRKVADTVAFTSGEGKPNPYTLIERTTADIRENLSYALFREAVEKSPALVRRFQHDGVLSIVRASAGASFSSPNAQRDPYGDVNSMQQLEIAIAS